MEKFVDACISGEVNIKDIGKYIKYWQDNKENQSLREYLGFSKFEYERWMENGDECLKSIIKYHKS